MISTGDLLHKQFPPEANLVGSGLLKNNSILVIGGPPKLGKSFALVTMLMQLACGKPLLGVSRTDINNHRNRTWLFPVTRPCRVLLFEQEVGEMDMKERISGMLSAFTPEQRQLIEANLFIHSTDRECRLDDGPGFDKMQRMIVDFKPDIVAIDPLKEYHLQNENDALGMSLVFRRILLLKDRQPFALLVNHHTVKENPMYVKEGADALRGSSYLYGLGDTFLMLKPNRKAGGIMVNVTLRRGKPIADFGAAMDEANQVVVFTSWLRGRDKDVDDAVNKISNMKTGEFTQ